MSHTPGPWRKEHGFIMAGESIFIASPLSGSSQLYSTAGDLEAEANARLIAAAPELLAALETIAEQSTMPKSAYDKMNAAIEKAKRTAR